jgi:hypothetical protein
MFYCMCGAQQASTWADMAAPNIPACHWPIRREEVTALLGELTKEGPSLWRWDIRAIEGKRLASLRVSTLPGARRVRLRGFEDEGPGGGGLSEASASIWNAIGTGGLLFFSRVKLVRGCLVLTTSCSIASASCPKPRTTRDSPNTKCCASRGRTCSVRFGRSASFTDGASGPD